MPILVQRLVGIMSDRVREMTTADQQQDKLMALGKLSAGLAHELNNPAAGATRAANDLIVTLAELRAADLRLCRHDLTNRTRGRDPRLRRRCNRTHRHNRAAEFARAK